MLSPDFIAELRKRFAGDLRFDLASRILYSTDASIYQIEPLGVAIPRTQEDLQAAVELAAKHRLPLIARGSGTSLAGQAIGAGLIVDCSRWLDRLVELDPERREATVEPGVILAALNRAAARHGLQFGPDPASAERATMGGVIANNGTGAHSILYGMAADHMHSADVLLSDGSSATLGEITARGTRGEAGNTASLDAARRDVRSSGRYAGILKAATDIREQMGDEIRKAYPTSWRNSAGYRLNYLLPWSPSAPAEWTGERYPANLQPGTFNLSHLLAGSEGTIAVIARARVKLVKLPRHTILGILAYPNLVQACDAIPKLLQLHPSAIELLPQLILRLARTSPTFARQMSWVEGDPSAVLVVEFSGEDEVALRERVNALGPGVVAAEAPDEQLRVWNVRKVGLGILDSRPQRTRPAAFIEDCAIPVERLGEFVREIERIMQQHGALGGIYAHASAGCLHVRPILDLQTAAGVRDLRSISAETATLALGLGGSMASEHGDGIARGEWLRQTYGEAVFDGMKRLKEAADPEHLLNPGKMLDAPPMDQHLRFGEAYRAAAWKPGLDFTSNGSLTMAIEQCNGQGVCRKAGGVMCPSFQATREEMHSTRGRANLLRAMITKEMAVGLSGSAAGSADSIRSHLQSKNVGVSEAAYEALDLCLGCKACKAECPSGVDMAKLKSEFLHHYYTTRRRFLRDYVFGYFHVTARLLSAGAPIVNNLGRISLIRRFMAGALRLTGERPLPAFRYRTPRARLRSGYERVILLRDPFNHFVDTSVEQAALDLLFHADFNVCALGPFGAGASLISKGFLSAARGHARKVVEELEHVDPSGDVPLIVIEPSELSTVRHEYADILMDLPERLRQRLARALSVEEFLLEVKFPGALPISRTNQHVVIHPHCHQKAEPGWTGESSGSGDGSAEFLRACGYEVSMVEAGCCGMAGTFGYEAEHYELSRKIGEMRLFPQIRQHSASLIAATGAACRMHISQNTGAVVEHPLVLAARALLAPPRSATAGPS